MKETQHTIILGLLDDGMWHCSSEFYSQFIADPRTRLAELKKQGYNLEWRWCQTHNFHKGNSKEWRLMEAGEKNQLSHLPHNCPSWNIYKVYCPDCRLETLEAKLF